AIKIDPNYAMAHYNLGIALKDKGDLDGAIRCYRTAIRIDQQFAEAHCNLGNALRDMGQFAEALPALQRGHELGTKRKDWRYPSGQWVKNCEMLLALDTKLPTVLKGEAKPMGVNEQIGLAK